MKKMRFLILVLFIGYNVRAVAQSNDPNIYVCQLIDSVKAAYCKSDTAKTIAFLEQIYKNYPDDAGILSTNKVLADLYMAQGRYEEAKAALLYAINLKPVNYYVYGNTNICNKILSYLEPSRGRADLCVGLSQVYLHEEKPDSSIYYLSLADNQLMPYKNGSTGYFMYRCFLSPYFADYFMAVGDTSKAVGRLLDHFLKAEGDQRALTQKLKAILRHRYSQDQIAGELRNGLQNIEFVMINDGTVPVMRLVLFDYTIREFGAPGDMKPFKAYFKNHESFKQLLRRDD